ncbi:interleukin 31 receptor A [Homo sapiens]|uniref:Interleukin 31 receptor A n=1 Tax=Homo sapiens TaxID=9606 RepID=A0A494BZY2_HUMAN|nr:interleukin 31 receptor A [Homo sapiens]KAI4021304.1 interleukin 31 receptor A [Homo sapiens]
MCIRQLKFFTTACVCECPQNILTIMQSISQHKWVSATLTWAGLKSTRKARRQSEWKHSHILVWIN